MPIPIPEQNEEAKYVGHHIMCATSAAAIVAGFVKNPEDEKSILIESKAMAQKLHVSGQQPNSMSTEEAHAVALEFAIENNILVSNVHQISLISVNPDPTKRLREMNDYAITTLDQIVQSLKVGDRLFLGMDNLAIVDDKQGGWTLELSASHAQSAIKTKEGVIWFQSNERGDPAPKIIDKPTPGDQFKYFITRPKNA